MIKRFDLQDTRNITTRDLEKSAIINMVLVGKYSTLNSIAVLPTVKENILVKLDDLQKQQSESAKLDSSANSISVEQQLSQDDIKQIDSLIITTFDTKKILDEKKLKTIRISDSKINAAKALINNFNSLPETIRDGRQAIAQIVAQDVEKEYVNKQNNLKTSPNNIDGLLNSFNSLFTPIKAQAYCSDQVWVRDVQWWGITLRMNQCYADRLAQGGAIMLTSSVIWVSICSALLLLAGAGLVGCGLVSLFWGLVSNAAWKIGSAGYDTVRRCGGWANVVYQGWRAYGYC